MHQFLTNLHRNLTMLLILCVLLLSASSIGSYAYPNASLITSVPGFSGTLPSKHYAGYVNIDGKPAGTKNLFYYFVESEKNPSTDPVVLWLNGGPGCSSFDGFVYEHGPFRFQGGESGSSLPTLTLNPYSWSKVSNIIYLDSPCGVGLSYSDDPRNYVTGDLQTAADSHAVLLKWFEMYPEFQSNPFYISGESYAGIYIPTLASQVVQGIEGGVQPLINFKGYLIGNGIVADDTFEDDAIFLFAHGMGLISNDIFEGIERNCYGKHYNASTCHTYHYETGQALQNLNPYDILEPCYTYTTSSSIHENRKISNGRHRWTVMTSSHRDVRVPAAAAATTQDGTNRFHVPCMNDDLAFAWLNDPTVREAIHAAPVSEAGQWEICAQRVRKTYSSDSGSMIPYHVNLTTQGYRALIYSGDHDSVVPFTGTQAWTRSLRYKITEPWRFWLSNDQVAGYLQGYDKNLTFLTIKGAGHMVPQYKPMESLDFYTRWLEGNQI